MKKSVSFCKVLPLKATLGITEWLISFYEKNLYKKDHKIVRIFFMKKYFIRGITEFFTFFIRKYFLRRVTEWFFLRKYFVKGDHRILHVFLLLKINEFVFIV